jgi:hypothetical protein
MNTLTDLRRTLDQHADEIADAAAVARSTAVHHRIAEVRRRRRAVGAGLAAVVVATTATVAVSTRADRDAQPAGAVVLGQRAPGSMTSLGYTYRATGDSEVFDGSGRMTVAAADEPRLVTWTTSDPDASVRLRLPSGQLWSSTRTGFRDFVLLPAEQGGVLRVAASRGSVGIATYDLTDRAPAGYTRGGVTYRHTVAGRQLVGAVVGDPGQTTASTTIVLPRGTEMLAPVCTGGPRTLQVHVVLAGSEATRGSCDDPDSFDPGGSGGYIGHYGRAGRAHEVKVFVTREGDPTSPVTAGEYPDLRIGVGVYGEEVGVRVAGQELSTVQEDGGHTWRLVDTMSAARGPLRVPSSGEDRIAWLAWSARGTVRATFHARGEEPDTSTYAVGPGGAVGNLWIPAQRPATATLADGKGPLGVAWYTRVD